MEAVERSVTATVAYYSVGLRVPITAYDAWHRLIPSARLAKPSSLPTLGTVVTALDNLVARGILTADSGFYLLPRTPSLVPVLIDREKISAQKWRCMLRFARWFQGVPFMEAIFVSGSLALNASGPESDWDVFVVVRARRLYMARLFLLMSAWLMGRLRTKRHHRAPDTFCFNHFVTTDGLKLRHQSLYVAHTLASLVPVHDPRNYLMRMHQANHWTELYVRRSGDDRWTRRSVRYSGLLTLVRGCGEWVVSGWLGNVLEYVVRRWMQNRIFRDPVTCARGGRITADDHELEFHPRSFEAIALTRYNEAIARILPGLLPEHDSGLS